MPPTITHDCWSKAKIPLHSGQLSSLDGLDHMARKGDIKRQNIIDTANRLFYQRGFHQTSLGDIAAESGVPKGNFYFYFRSKEEILEAVVDGRLERLRVRLAEWTATLADPADRLSRMSELLVRDAVDVIRYGCPIGSLVGELGKQKAELKEGGLRMFDMLLSWAEEQFSLLAGPKDAGDLARQLMVRMQGAATLASAYADETWLLEEQQRIFAWIDRFR